MCPPMQWLRDEGVFGWNYRYLLLHPWVIFREIYMHTRWFIQRGRRGYADCDAWSLDSYLSRWMPEAVRRLKGGPGFPVNAYTDLFGDMDMSAEWPEDKCKQAHEYWQTVVERIALGFEAARRIQDYDFKPEELEGLMAQTNDGLKLFQRYYFNLWD